MQATRADQDGGVQGLARLFPTLAKRFKTIDPKSVEKILTYNGHFHRIFVSPSASRVALQHCRPVIALDGTFLLNLFTKTFPEWMERENAAIISDRDKGLVPAAKEFLPDTIPHYFCGWHLEQNIRRWGTDVKNFFWRMLKARLLPKWKALLREARVDFSEMADYLFGKEERPRAPPVGVGSSAPPPANPEETTQEARARIRLRARMSRRARAQRLRQRKAAHRRAARRTTTDGTAGVAEKEEVDGGSDAAAAGAAGDVHAEDGADADDAAENGAAGLNDTQDGPAWNDQAWDGAAGDDGAEDGEAGNGPAGAATEAAPDTRAPCPARGPLIVVPTPPNLEARRPPFDIDDIILSARYNYFPGHGRRHAADGVGTTQALLPPPSDPAGPSAAAGTGADDSETPGGDAAGTGAPGADMPAAEPDLTHPWPDLGGGFQAGTDEDVIGEGLDFFTTDENGFSNPSTSRPQRPAEDDGPARARTGFYQNKAGSKYRNGIHPKHWARDWYRKKTYERGARARARTEYLTDKAMKRLMDKRERSKHYKVTIGGPGYSTVRTLGSRDFAEWRSFNVDLRPGKKHCECGNWKEYAFPCSHVVAFCREMQTTDMDHVSDFYTTATLRQTYSGVVHGSCVDRLVAETTLPLRGVCEPPQFKRCDRGRPRTVRRMEGQAPKKTYRCSNCRADDHNKSRCLGLYGAETRRRHPQT
ncbi:unnamed protein product [Closterium sp. Yama58-4]|nr:unnamed protein product [Closterium sp. Yama58-4]